MASSTGSYYAGGEDAYALSQNGQYDQYDQREHYYPHGQYGPFDQNDETTRQGLSSITPPRPSIRISGETLHSDFNGADPSNPHDGHHSSTFPVDTSSFLALGTGFLDTPDPRQLSVTPDIDNGFASPHTPLVWDPDLPDGRQDEPWNSVAAMQPAPEALPLLLPSPSRGSGRSQRARSRSYSQRSSQGPGSTSSHPRWHCAQCNVSFSDHKSLTRHMNEAVAHQDDVYICKCGKTAARKNNFTHRHFRRCGRANSHGSLDVFTCICSYRTGDAAAMEHHWSSDCPRQGKRGRPKKT